jgi:hypothetical protein
LQGRWEGEDEIMGTPPRLMSGAGLECVISMSGCGEGNHFLNLPGRFVVKMPHDQS